MKKFMAILLLILFSLTIVMPNNKVNAVSNNIVTTTIDVPITDWVIDTKANLISAISTENKSLLFLNATTLQQEATIPLEAAPSDIIQDRNKIYISLTSINQILEFDITTKKQTQIFKTYNYPSAIAKYNNKLYFTSNRLGVNYVFEYDLNEKIDTIIRNLPIENATLTTNYNTNTLYVGDTSYGLSYYNLTTNEKTGSYYSKNKFVLFDDTEIIYAHMALDINNPNNVFGSYDLAIDESYLALANDVLISTSGFYNKDSFNKFGEFKDEINLAQATNNILFTYSNSSKTIKRYYSVDKINSSNIVSLVGGYSVNSLSEPNNPVNIEKELISLKLNSKFSDLIVDENNEYIYATSFINRGLYFIKEDTLNIEKSIYLPSYPTDILQDGDKIYISFKDINQIYEYDIKTKERTSIIYTEDSPRNLAKNNNKLYFTHGNTLICEYDLITKTESTLNLPILKTPIIKINKEKNILYVGESDSVDSNLYYYDLTQNKILSSSNTNGFSGYSSPSFSLLVDNDSVYYAGRRFSATDSTKILGEYSSDTSIEFLSVNDKHILTNKGIYNKNTYDIYKPRPLNTFYDLGYLSDNDVLYYYQNFDNTLLRSEPDVTAPIVQGVKDGDIYTLGYPTENITITFDEGVATLNGQPFTSGDKITTSGHYTLEVIDEAKNKTTISFTIKKFGEAEDVTQDGLIDALDLSLVASGYNKTYMDSGFRDKLDIRRDGVIDIFDLVKVSKKLN